MANSLSPRHPDNITKTVGDTGVTGFLNFVRRPVFYRTRRFGNLFCFRPQVRTWEALTLRVPLERANLSHWTFRTL